MFDAGSCPLCSWGRNDSFAITGCRRLRLFPNMVAVRSRAENLGQVRTHLLRNHPNELAALRAGQQLNPGVFQSPMVPLYVPNIYFQAVPELATRYLTPASHEGYFDRRSNAQKMVVAKHMEPSLHVDKDNQSQAQLTDMAAGKLLTSQLESEQICRSHDDAAWMVNPSIAKGATCPWLQDNRSLSQHKAWSSGANAFCRSIRLEGVSPCGMQTILYILESAQWCLYSKHSNEVASAVEGCARALTRISPA